MSEEEKKKDMYWLDKFNGKCQGGIFYRAPEFIEFMEKVEKKAGKVVAIVFEEGNKNIELIHEPRTGR